MFTSCATLSFKSMNTTYSMLYWRFLFLRGWEFNVVVECLSSKHTALVLVLSSEKNLFLLFPILQHVPVGLEISILLSQPPECWAICITMPAHKVPEKNRHSIGNWAKGHLCYILANNLTSFHTFQKFEWGRMKEKKKPNKNKQTRKPKPKQNKGLGRLSEEIWTHHNTQGAVCLVQIVLKEKQLRIVSLCFTHLLCLLSSAEEHLASFWLLALDLLHTGLNKYSILYWPYTCFCEHMCFHSLVFSFSGMSIYAYEHWAAW